MAAVLLALAAAAGISGCSACDSGDTPPVVTPPITSQDPPDDNKKDEDYVNVSVTQAKLTLKDYEVITYNFVRCFSITDNGKGVSSKNYIDASAVMPEAGEYTVTCTYKEKVATLTVEVEASDSNITVSGSEIKITSSEAATYDFKALFNITVDGKKYAVTDDMVTSDVKSEAGVYAYSVSFLGKTQTLRVTVVDENAIEIINSYGVLELTKEDLAGYDYTKLFSIYVGGAAEKVLDEYIDASSISDPENGQIYSITIAFAKNGREATSTAKIKVVDKTRVSITSQNIVTYPNGADIDLKSLFTIKNGNQVIEVTDDMVSGSVDYSKEGDNTITLNYGGKTATAVVSIKLGVIIDYAASDTVLIEKGTDISSYDFGSDFNVIINGIRFTDLSRSYFEIEDADFNKVGEYTVKIKIPYNTKPLGATIVRFDYFEKTITYKVVEKKTEYSIKILQENLVLPAGTTKYNVYDNVNVVINGLKRKLYENRDDQDITTCYAQVISKPIDFSLTEEQVVEIDIYVYGPYEEPVRIAYSVRIDNGVEVTGRERVVFSGTTVYARELFTITENGNEVAVTDDMVSGKIDLFNAGIYFVTATYKGVTAQSKAVVLDSAMTGTYKTMLTEIEPYEYDDDNDVDYDVGWGDYDNDDDYFYQSISYAASRASTAYLKDLIIRDDGEIFIGTDKAEIISIIDDSTFTIRLYTNEYVFRYQDGAVSLDPDNSLRLSYYDRRRPMVYFNENRWKTENYIQINSSKNGYNVLQKDSAGNLLAPAGSYTIDLIQLKSKDDGKYYWYGMKTHFLTKYSSDTYFADEIFAFATLSPGFEQVAGCVATVNLGGANYEFTMSTATKAIINRTAETVSAFAGITFKGTVDGKAATFAVAGNDRISYTVNGKKLFDLTPNDQNSLKNGGVDYGENTWLVYESRQDKEHTPFSYRFRLDAANKTFTVDERDDLYGRYVYGNVSFFFDGYGTGEVNFNTAYSTATAFSYKRTGANIEITYLNPDPTFAYGKTAKFILADYKNILTVREITGNGGLIGKQFVNSVITDGAIVEVKNFVLGRGVAENELFEGLSITTKDGKLTRAQMESKIEGTSLSYVDKTLIDFGRAGFYQLKINIPMNGEVKTAYYAVQILDSIYGGNPLVNRYTQTAVNAKAALNIDEYGRVSGEFAGLAFKGSAFIADNKFTATAECATGKLTLSGELLANGIVRVSARGALMFTDCFTTGTVRVCGTAGYVLRAITANGNTVYMLANAATSVGNVVEVEGSAAPGSVIKITDGSKEYVVKVVGWDGSDKGLVLSDAVRGAYTLDGADDLILDGFGAATYGTRKGEYAASGSSITVLFGTEVGVFRIDTKTKTYTVSTTAVDSKLFAGKSFSAEYNFFCQNDMYKAITVFEFKDDGKVTVKSASVAHDEDCDDKYDPEFATASGVEGTFTVVGNKITVKVNGKTIVFTFTDAVGLDTLTCTSTDVSSSSHGYFKPDSEFTRA